jgi:mannose-6-phosphate isomerase
VNAQLGISAMKQLTGVVQPYAWGSKSAIPEFLGVEPTGEPQAELWFGAHPLAPSTVGGAPLNELVDRDPVGIIGPAAVRSFGPRLPFLVKIIAADQPLSLQAHPSREQAEAGYAREQHAGVPRDAPHRVYRDGWPKPEVLCALFDTEALCGFRDPAETYELFACLGVPSALRLVRMLRQPDAPAEMRLAETFGRLLRLDQQHRGVIGEVERAARTVDGEGVFGQFARTAVQLAAYYPGDPGVLAALLMNRISLRPLDAIFLPAGNLHAYLCGGGVEIMANSDNVMRGGLTPKHVDVPELLRVVDFTPGFAGLITPVEESAGVWRYPAPAPEFALWRIEVTAQPAIVPALGAGRILLVTEGLVHAGSGSAELNLRRGECALIRPHEQVAVRGAGQAFVGAPGQP